MILIKKQRLICDADGVITDSIASIVSCYDEDFQFYNGFKKIHSTDIHTYNFDELTLASKEYINHLWNRPRFFERLQLIPYAREVLTILNIQYDIEIATAGYSPNLKQKEIYLSNRLPFLKKINLINLKEYPDKSHLDMNNAIFIDDQANNLVTSNATHKICFGDVEEWNNSWSGERCYNWHELMKRLFHLKKNAIKEVWKVFQGTINDTEREFRSLASAHDNRKIFDEYKRWLETEKKMIVESMTAVLDYMTLKDMEAFLLFVVEEMDELHTVEKSGNEIAIFKQLGSTMANIYWKFIRKTEL